MNPLPKFKCPNHISCEYQLLCPEYSDISKGETWSTFNAHFHFSLSFLLRESHEKCKEGEGGVHPCRCVWPFCLISIRQGLVSWVWEDLTYENSATGKIQTTAFRGFLVTGQVCILMVVLPENPRQCGQDLAWPQSYPPFLESQVPLLLKEKRQERIFFLFQILGKCLFRSILVSAAQHCCVFLPKELEGYFKNTFTFPISPFIPVAPYFLSFCPFFFGLLGFNVDFLCHGIKTTCFGQGSVDMLCCQADPRLSQHPLTLHTRGAAADVETPVSQVSVMDLCKLVLAGHVCETESLLKNKGKGMDNNWN